MVLAWILVRIPPMRESALCKIWKDHSAVLPYRAGHFYFKRCLYLIRHALLENETGLRYVQVLLGHRSPKPPGSMRISVPLFKGCTGVPLKNQSSGFEMFANTIKLVIATSANVIPGWSRPSSKRGGPTF